MNPQENSFLLEAEGKNLFINFQERRRRIRQNEDEKKRKEEEEQKAKEEKEKKLEDDELKSSKRNTLNTDVKEKMTKIPLIDYDKYRKMDSNFFNKNASKIESAFSKKRTNTLNLNDERYDNASYKNSLDQSLNFSNLDDNLNQNDNSNVIMKKIVLLNPDSKLQKEEKSNKSSINCKIQFFFTLFYKKIY